MKVNLKSHTKMNPHLPNFAKETIDEVAATMKIAYEPWMLDWPIEVSDGTRVEEFLGFCENENRREQGAAMAVVLLASLEDAFRRGRPSDGILSRAAIVFKKNPELLEYWRCSDAVSGGEIFSVTPWVRSL